MLGVEITSDMSEEDLRVDCPDRPGGAGGRSHWRDLRAAAPVPVGRGGQGGRGGFAAAILRQTRDDFLRRAPELLVPREQGRDLGMVTDDGPLFPVDSAQQVAERTRVGIDFAQALESPESSENVLVQADDTLHVPRYTPTVDVQGAVGVESKVLWREGEGLGYYISQAGGYLEEADEDRVWIRFANGEVSTRGGGFLSFRGGFPEHHQRAARVAA